MKINYGKETTRERESVEIEREWEKPRLWKTFAFKVSLTKLAIISNLKINDDATVS